MRSALLTQMLKTTGSFLSLVEKENEVRGMKIYPYFPLLE
jgi:hypothetical protein